MTDAATNLGAVKTRISVQKDFAKALMDAIDTGVGQLVDADMNEEFDPPPGAPGSLAARHHGSQPRQPVGELDPEPLPGLSSSKNSLNMLEPRPSGRGFLLFFD